MKFKAKLTIDDIKRMIKAEKTKKKRKKLKITDEIHDEKEHEIYIRCLLSIIDVEYGEKEYLGEIEQANINKIIKITKRVIT